MAVKNPISRGRKPNYSPLMKAKMKAAPGEVVNLCQFGCEDHHLDDHGRCCHVVGHCDPRGQKPVAGVIMYDELGQKPNQYGHRSNTGRVLKTQKGDKFVRITSSYRVYRDVELTKEELARRAQLDLQPRERPDHDDFDDDDDPKGKTRQLTFVADPEKPK